jgi:hypothetical protein
MQFIGKDFRNEIVWCWHEAGLCRIRVTRALSGNNNNPGNLGDSLAIHATATAHSIKAVEICA